MATKDPKGITPRAEDYSQWYLDVIAGADLSENAPVRGCMIIKPYGYAIWEAIQRHLDRKFQETGVENAYFPLLIPERLLKREEAHVEGFAPEVAVVTQAGGKELEEPYVIRPTSETIMYETFSKWIQSYRDLPLLLNQWANVVRWELRPRPFLRTTEFLWQEGHTVHETEAEADARARQMLGIYQRFAEDILAIPVVVGEKSATEKFAGAARTYSAEAMMQDGRALQFATSHNLGQNFAKVFDVTFLDREGQQQFGWQTSWGMSTRSIGGLIMTHSDDVGLVLPPNIAPKQVVITTIGSAGAPEVAAAADTLLQELHGRHLRAHLDVRDLRPGEKFYHWERRGVPLRIEIGPKDAANGSCVLVRRDTGAKESIPLGEAAARAEQLMVDIQQTLFERARTRLQERTVRVDTWDAFTQAIEAGNFVLAHWSGDPEVERAIKEELGATVRCIPFDQPLEAGTCVKSGAPSTVRALFARSY